MYAPKFRSWITGWDRINERTDYRAKELSDEFSVKFAALRDELFPDPRLTGPLTFGMLRLFDTKPDLALWEMYLQQQCLSSQQQAALLSGLGQYENRFQENGWYNNYVSPLGGLFK